MGMGKIRRCAHRFHVRVCRDHDLPPEPVAPITMNSYPPLFHARSMRIAEVFLHRVGIGIQAALRMSAII